MLHRGVFHAVQISLYVVQGVCSVSCCKVGCFMQYRGEVFYAVQENVS